jgi:hypothetical protein
MTTLKLTGGLPVLDVPPGVDDPVSAAAPAS